MAFAPTDLSPTASLAFDEYSCATTSWTSDTTYACRMGPATGTPTDAVMQVSVASVTGTLAGVFTFDGND